MGIHLNPFDPSHEPKIAQNGLINETQPLLILMPYTSHI